MKLSTDLMSKQTHFEHPNTMYSIRYFCRFCSFYLPLAVMVWALCIVLVLFTGFGEPETEAILVKIQVLCIYTVKSSVLN